jgi:hypothetical protein
MARRRPKSEDELLAELVAGHEAEVNAFAVRRVQRLLSLLETARKEIRGSIGEEDLEPARIQKLSKQIDGIRRELAQDIEQFRDPVDTLAKLAQGHHAAETAVLVENAIIIPTEAISPAILYQIAENNMAMVKSDIVDSQLRAIKTRLFSKVGVAGLNPRKVAHELAGADSQFTGMYHRLENVFRTETSTVYNTQKVEAITESNKLDGISFRKRIVEHMDYSRNHPISLVLNNLVQENGKPFRAAVGEVEAAASKLGRGRKKGGGVAGIFWTQQNGYYMGDRLPAHYMERGTMVATEKPISDSQNF